MNPQSPNERVEALAVILCFEMMARFLLPLVPYDLCYYGVCGLFNAAMVHAVISMDRTPLTLDLAWLLRTELFFQCLGAWLYVTHLPHQIYNWSIHLTVTVIYIRILAIGGRFGHYTCDLGWAIPGRLRCLRQ